MSESAILKRVMMEASKLGLRVWRNNTGALRDQDGRLVRYGLCVGSSDLIGLIPVTITPDMIGQTLAVFTAIEVKAPGKKPTEEQAKFLAAIRKNKGIALLIDDEKKLKSMLDAALE